MEKLSTGPFGVNTWIVPVKNNFVFIVDPACCKTTGDESKIVSFLSKNNLIPLGIFLTHGHFDHIPGTKILKETFPQLQIAIHKNDLFMAGKGAASAQFPALRMMGLEMLSETLENLPEPDRVVSGGETLSKVFDSAGEAGDTLAEWKVLHTPGHTEGSCCLYNESKKILISGDTVFYHSWGRTDLPGGDESKMVKSLSILNKNVLPETLVYPGHDMAGFTFGDNF